MARAPSEQYRLVGCRGIATAASQAIGKSNAQTDDFSTVVETPAAPIITEE
jgi:hypothetical protein